MNDLTIEDIKYICEEIKPEGFAIVKTGLTPCGIESPDGGVFHSIEGFLGNTNVYFPLFLQKTCDKLGLYAFNDKDREDLISNYLFDKEVWSPVDSYRGVYEVSNTGKVRRNCTVSCSGQLNQELKQQLDKDGYYRVNLSIKNKRSLFLVSRLVAQAFRKDYNELLYIDHVDGNTQNNHIDNLRMADHCMNSMNTKKRKGGSSKYKGVYFHTRSKKWISKITCRGKQETIGYFNDEEEAGRAYDKKALELFGEYAKTNEMLGLYIIDHIRGNI